MQQWNDQSGNARNVSQGTSGSRATYKTSIINGLPVLRFDGGDSYASIAMDSLWGANGVGGDYYTIFIVCTATNTSATNAAASESNQAIFADTSNGNFGVMWKNGAPLHYTWNGAYKNIQSDSVANDTFAILEMIKDEPIVGHLESTIRIRTNAGTQATLADGSINGNGTLTIGNGNGGVHLTGDIAEIIVYANDLSSTDCTTVRDYLNAKYAIF